MRRLGAVLWLVAFGCGQRTVHVGLVPAAPGAGELVPDPEWAFKSGRFSPDVSQIAFHALVNGTDDIAGVMKSDGTEPRQLAVTHSPLTSVAWSPDGRQLYFTSSTGIESVDPQGTGLPTLVTESTDATDLDVSSDGAALLWVKSDGSLHSLQRNQSGATAKEEAHHGSDPRFDENGAVPGYVYVGVSPTGHPLQRDILGTTGPSGNVTSDLGPLASVSVLGKDRYVVTSGVGIERVTQDGMRTVLLTRTGTMEVDASVDGKRILYLVSGKGSLFVMNP